MCIITRVKITELVLKEKADFNNREATLSESQNPNEKARGKGKDLIESLHVMFTLYHVFANNQNMIENN